MADEGSIIVGGLGLASRMCGPETHFLSAYPETRPSLTLVEERVAEGVPGIRGPAAPLPWGGLEGRCSPAPGCGTLSLFPSSGSSEESQGQRDVLNLRNNVARVEVKADTHSSLGR